MKHPMKYLGTYPSNWAGLFPYKLPSLVSFCVGVISRVDFSVATTADSYQVFRRAISSRPVKVMNLQLFFATSKLTLFLATMLAFVFSVLLIQPSSVFVVWVIGSSMLTLPGLLHFSDSARTMHGIINRVSVGSVTFMRTIKTFRLATVFGAPVPLTFSEFCNRLAIGANYFVFHTDSVAHWSRLLRKERRTT